MTSSADPYASVKSILLEFFRSPEGRDYINEILDELRPRPEFPIL